MADLIDRVAGTMREYRMITPGAAALAGVSGGPDSVAMMHLLWRLQEELGFRLHVAHFHHGLRGEEADADQVFVESLCRKLGVPFHTARAGPRPHAPSLEAVLRIQRHAFLRRVALATGATAVALAHTSDDQAETVLLRLARGTGISGLGGMAPVGELVGDLPVAVRGGKARFSRDTGRVSGEKIRVIRPLLYVSRDEIVTYLRKQGLGWREDSTNRDRRFFRNRIRHEVLPYLEAELNPRLRRLLVNLAEQARAEDAWLQEQADEVWRELTSLGGVERDHDRGIIFIPARFMTDQPLAMQRRLWRRAGAELGVDFDFVTVERLRGLLSGPPGTAVTLPGRVQARVFDNGVRLWLAPRAVGPEGALPEVPLRVPGDTAAPEWGLVFHAEERPWTGGDPRAVVQSCPGPALVVDAGRVEDGLRVRPRRPGDRFWPLGSPGPRKLKGFFIAAGIPLAERYRIPLVVSQGGIVGVLGYRPDESCKVTSTTRRVVILWAEPIPGAGETS